MTNKCPLCEKEFEGYGHNSEPIAKGFCCDSCNLSKVIPSRLMSIRDFKSCKVVGCDNIAILKLEYYKDLFPEKHNGYCLIHARERIKMDERLAKLEQEELEETEDEE